MVTRSILFQRPTSPSPLVNRKEKRSVVGVMAKTFPRADPKEFSWILDLMHDSGHDLLLATGPTKSPSSSLRKRSSEKGPAIHPLFSNLDGLLRNDTVFHVQIILVLLLL